MNVTQSGVSHVIKSFEDDYKTLENALLSRKLDCCFTTKPDQPDIEFIPLKKDKLFCIVSTQSPLRNQETVTAEELQQFPLIKPKKGWDNEITAFFTQNNINPNVKYEISDDQAIIALVQSNLGINIRPELVLKKFQKDIIQIELEKGAERTIGLAATKQKTQATKRFLSTVTALYPPIER